jgi:hypothetical protein
MHVGKGKGREVEKEREMEMEQKGNGKRNGKGNTRDVLAMTHAPPEHDASSTGEARVIDASGADMCMHVGKGKGRELEREQNGEGNGKGNTRDVLATTHAPPEHDVSMTRNSPDHGVLVTRDPRTPDTLMMIFAHWKKVMNLPQAVLDKKRREVIQNALSMGYTAQQLCQAIDGCSRTPHNMGKNEQGQRYDGLHIIFRDADQIERFIRNFYRPPQSQKIGGEREQASIKNLQNWLDKKTKTQEIHNFEAAEDTKNAGWEEDNGNQ